MTGVVLKEVIIYQGFKTNLDGKQCQLRYGSVHIGFIFILMIAANRDTCMWIGNKGVQRYGLIPLYRLRIIMVTVEENCEILKGLQQKIWRSYEMNGATSVVVTLSLPRVTSVSVTDDTLSVDLEDGRTVSVPIGWYPRLAYGTPAERKNVKVSGAGFGLHWPDLDEDIGIEGILLGKRSNESPQSFEKWLQARKQDKPV